MSRRVDAAKIDFREIPMPQSGHAFHGQVQKSKSHEAHPMRITPRVQLRARGLRRRHVGREQRRVGRAFFAILGTKLVFTLKMMA